MKFWLVWLFLLCGTLHAGPGKDIKPLSASAEALAEFDHESVQLEYFSRQVELAQRIALNAAAQQGRATGLCCYHAVALYVQLETGQPLPQAKLNFAGGETRLADVRQRLAQLLQLDMLSYENITAEHTPQTLSSWLVANLSEGEPSLLGLGVVPVGKTDTFAHTVIALRIGNDAYVIDSGRDGRLLLAKDFFEKGIADYTINFDYRFALIRTLRQGVEYHFSSYDLKLENIALNEQSNILSDVVRRRLGRSFSAQELLQAYRQQQARSGKQPSVCK